jgi:BirA family biotin operon repressor/biotin-[acetyl-CoA-carboxylase] ligase
LTVDLRWPNDLADRPAQGGGILVESKNRRQLKSYFAVVGIGINVHQRSFAPGLSTPATSLDLEAGRRVSVSS